MLKSFKTGNSNKNKKISIGDISNPTSNIPDTQLKNMNTISIQKAQMLQQKQAGNEFESFGHQDYSRVSSATSMNIAGSGFSASGAPTRSSDSSVKKTFVNRVTSEVSVKSSHSLASSSNNTGGHLYGIVLYDFQAERNDELDCKAGENLVIFAHHENEWFIAKTIDRIGGPGLVPCGYVMVIDLTTGFASNNDLEKDIEISSLPTVVEWKSSLQQQKSKNLDLKNNSLKSTGGSSRNTNSYNSSINYNDISESVKKTNSANRGHTTSGIENKQTSESSRIYNDQSGGNRSSYSVTSSSNNKNPISKTNNNSTHEDLDDDFILEANVTEYIWEDQKYKFIVKCLTSFSKERFLKRSYEDFYNLQINILESFAEESGKVILPDGKMSQRIVPYIPGPVPYVTEDITKKRLGDLNTYVNDLINLPNNISRSNKVLTLFQIQRNGFDTESQHNNHLRSISQGKFTESMQDQYKPQTLQEPDTQLQNIPEVSADNLNATIFSSPDKNVVKSVSESNHGTIGVDDENTLKLQGLQISTLDKEDQESKGIKKTVSHSALKSLSNTNSHLDDSPSKRPMKLSVNTQTENSMDKSQSNNTITDLVNTPMTATFAGGKSVKIKFYYADDIFALLLNSNITISELKAKILKKIHIDSFKLFIKVGSSTKEEIKTDGELQEAIALKHKITILD